MNLLILHYSSLKYFCKNCWFRKQKQQKLTLEERLIYISN